MEKLGVIRHEFLEIRVKNHRQCAETWQQCASKEPKRASFVV